MKKKLLLAIFLFPCLAALSQNGSGHTIKGTVRDKEKNEARSGASIKIKSGTLGTVTDDQGIFRLNVAQLPVTIEISYMGYETQEMEVKTTDEINVLLEPVTVELNPVIVGVTKSQIHSMVSPVSNEYISRKDLVNSPAESYWSSILVKRGMDVTTSSMTFKSYSTRGFNGSGVARVNQLMDGMDNQAPGLNFSIGNFIAPTELDVENIEILPGASSALYGAGGVNGTILVHSKSPFKYTGLSILARQGVTDIGKQQRNSAGGFFDYSLRWAKKIGDRFAFRVGAQYMQAKDWLANDTSNYLRTGSGGKIISGNRQSDPNYDGVNVYGDETSVDVRQFVGAIAMMYPPGSPQQMAILQMYNSMTNPTPVSRTGYKEIDVIDPVTKNFKLSGALHYKITDRLEAQLMGYRGTGNTVYTGNNRYALKGIKVGQYKLELKHRDWFLRGYTTQEDAGKAYSATVTSQYLNEAWKPSYDPANPLGSWYLQYASAYIQARGTGANDITAHNMARSFADQGRPLPGSAQFKRLFDSVRNVPIPRGGLFLDKSQLWVGEGQYNFSNQLKFAEIIVGADAKRYILSSQGTIFIDTAGSLKINEWGGYIQATKKLLNEKLTLSASGRYDKNENFSGKFTPRFTALVAIAKNNNIRMSYQTAYRFPTTLQQWIKLDVGNVILLGGLPWVNDYLQTKSTPTYVVNPNTGQMSPYTYSPLKPESLRSFEVGYRGLFDKKFLLDMYAYFGRYSDFLGRIVVVQPTASKPYSIVTNSDTKVKTWGMGVSMDYKMAKNYMLFLNAYTDRLTNVPNGFEAAFNTPQYRVNAGFGNTGLGKSQRVGFNINLRWQDDFYYEGGGFANGDVNAYTTLDAQVNYKLPKINSMIKIGGMNITNKFYQTAIGNPYIGGMYYVSFGYNIL